MELVCVNNTNKIHNYVLHPDNFVEPVEQALESVKGMELEHVTDCDSIPVEDTDSLKDGIDIILQGRDQNDIYVKH